VLALSGIAYKGKVVCGSQQNTVNYVWRLVVKLFSSLRIKIGGTYLVGLLTGDGLYDRVIVVRYLSTARDFSSKPANRLWSPPILIYKSTSKYFPGVKAVGVKWATHIHQAQML
jgi:hypothetical protein